MFNVNLLYMSNIEFTEKVNSINYAAMSYNELVTINLAFHLALGEVKLLMGKKREEEMNAHTHEYVAKMNNYGASKAEILACLEKEVVRITPYAPIDTQIIDEQTPAEENVNPDSNEAILALPEPDECNNGDVEVYAETPGDTNAQTTSDSGLEKWDEVNGQTNVQVVEETESSETKVEETDSNAVPENDQTVLMAKAVEMMETIPAPRDVDANAPYYAEATFSYVDSEMRKSSTLTGRNMCVKDLESFRSASETYFRLFLKKDVLEADEDHIVIGETPNSVRVRRYYFPELSYNDTSSNVEDSYVISDTERKELKKKESLLKKAIKTAKEISSRMGMPANAAFYDRLTLKKDGKELTLRGDPERFFEDAETLPEIMSSFETYARLVQENYYQVLAKDNCVAATTHGETFFVVLFNIPVKKKERKARRKSEPDTESVAELERKEAETSSSSAQNVRDSILNAVEMTKSLPLNDGTDNNAPYFVQRDFIITGSGDVVPKDRPFSQNVKDDNEFNGFRNKHRKFAKTMKARQCVSTDKYTAFIGNDGKTLTVYYYNQNAQG